jgi:hypothetical protein
MNAINIEVVPTPSNQRPRLQLRLNTQPPSNEIAAVLEGRIVYAPDNTQPWLSILFFLHTRQWQFNNDALTTLTLTGAQTVIESNHRQIITRLIEFVMLNSELKQKFLHYAGTGTDTVINDLCDRLSQNK